MLMTRNDSINYNTNVKIALKSLDKIANMEHLHASSQIA